MWKAETRGSTVVVARRSGCAQPDTRSDKLGVIFSHELLHLWVPNSLKLEGDYDWFFEGFTLYMALRTALELKVINFKGFLNTLAGAYDTYRCSSRSSFPELKLPRDVGLSGLLRFTSKECWWRSCTT